jgi:hypothetical protein
MTIAAKYQTVAFLCAMPSSVGGRVLVRAGEIQTAGVLHRAEAHNLLARRLLER